MPSLYDPSMQYNQPSTGGNGMDPMTMYAASTAVNALGNALTGGQEQPAQGNLHLVNPAQQALYNAMARGAMGGQGDFGFGSAIKQGKSQVQDFLSSRGVQLDPNSGDYGGAMGQMIGAASQGADQNRRQFAMGLLNSPLQIAQTAGANFIPGSYSRGPTTQAQMNQFGARDRYAFGDTPGWGADNQVALAQQQAQQPQQRPQQSWYGGFNDGQG